MITVYGSIRDSAGNGRRAEAEGATYEAARDALFALPGDGEKLLMIAMWPIG